MLLSEDQVKQGILDPDKEVRTAAVFYFANSFSQDRTIMPLAIQAVENHGWKDAFVGFSFCDKLPQNDRTIQWTIEQMERIGDPATEDEEYFLRHLSALLANADTALLLKHETAIIETKGIDPDVPRAISERIGLLAADSQTCWDELVEFCEQNKKVQYVTDVDLPRGNYLIESIARDEQFGERALSILAEPITDFTDNPMVWMEGFMVRLAGELRLREAVPLIIKKMHEDADWLNEECVDALSKIGTDSVVEAIAEDFLDSDWGFRLSGVSVLENIHTDAKVCTCLSLLKDATDPFDRGNLCRAMLTSFSSEAVEPTRQLVLNTPLDPDLIEVRSELVAACTLMGSTFPELDSWKEEATHDQEFRRQWYAKSQGTFDQAAPDVQTVATPTLVAANTVGRNDPCPCGSGKKYKKCCMN